MPEVIDSKETSAVEEEKLIQELQNLIKSKNLSVELVKKTRAPTAAAGCSRCTICPCMICW